MTTLDTELTTIKVPYQHSTHIVNYCILNINPKRYQLHNAIGGVHWRLEWERGIYNKLRVPRDHALIILLKWGNS